MLNAGVLRDRLAAILKAAFADGLLSEQTLIHRLSVLFDRRLVDPHGLVGDLSLRIRHQRWRWLSPPDTAVAAYRRLITPQRGATAAPLVLALNWIHGEDDLVIGRGPDCAVVLADHSVSREHARLVYRDGAWVIQDLDSKNGTFVNSKRVGRTHLTPGDRLQLGDQLLDID